MTNQIRRSIRGCRSLRGNVDRNVLDAHISVIRIRRSLRGNVDRNTGGYVTEDEIVVVPYVGTWIEIKNELDHLDKEYTSRSLRGNVDRNYQKYNKDVEMIASFPTWERG